MPSQAEHAKRLEGWEPPVSWIKLENPVRQARMQTLADYFRAGRLKCTGFTDTNNKGWLSLSIKVGTEVFTETGYEAPSEELMARIFIALEFNPEVRKHG